ncbi:bifunctional lysylphosphatidylglycerol flippase/synthetase MprF [Robertmurraya andreesenii]|uniref:Phosphatidylglycerol lysyltransferase n=1 Tax=Anoxybacillus andreesenii TaxID=1325932 RepID=A0ABT9V654_9BACL|nr:phosphatidylglycerol lysyltransferase [Robertmurraya andreesenii]
MDIRVMKEKALQLLKIIFPLFLLALATHEIWKFAMDLDIGLIKHEVTEIPLSSLIMAVILTVFAVSPMFLYDDLIVKNLGIRLSFKKFTKQTLIINSFSNLLGFGGLIGATLRTYFYQSNEIKRGTILKTIAHVTLFFLAGISILTWIVLIGYRDIPLLTETKWLYLAVIGVALYLPILLVFSFKWKNKENSFFIDLRTKYSLILVSLIEWTSVFLAIWILSRVLHIPVHFGDLYAIYVISACAGIVSMIPGGLGSFDLVFIWGTQYIGLQDEKVVVLLILYRLGYYFIPFLIGIFLFIKGYWDKWNRNWGNLPNAIIEYITHILLTVLIFVSGFIMLLSAALPGVIERFKIAAEIFSLPIMSLSHQFSVATGFMLLGLSRGIQYKVKSIYHITLVVLALAALFSLFKGLDYEEAIFLFIIALLLRSSKARFYRESYVLTWGRTLFDICLILFITIMFVVIGYANLPLSKINIPKKFIPYIITDYKDLFYSALIGLFITVLIFLIGIVFSRSRKLPLESALNHEMEILEHIHKYEGNVLTHLIFLNDKYIFWNGEKNVLFQYQIYADKLVVLGNPIGEKSLFPAAIEELMHTADLYGFTPVFYEINDPMLSTLHEHGYDFFKLGEEAYLNLNHFSLSGKKMKSLRAVKNKFERENYHFEILQPPYRNEQFDEMRKVSNEWLEGRREKGFSLGFFDERYLNRTEIGVLKGPSSEIFAFANIMPVYDKKGTISVDLMRFKPDAPSGTMDYMFLSLFEWAKEQGYSQFNLGMAPLSNVGVSKYSFFSEKIAAQIFLHGHVFFHFQGLRKFKEKFDVTWEPKYLAYRKKSSLPITVAQVTFLIGKKRGI